MKLVTTDAMEEWIVGVCRGRKASMKPMVQPTPGIGLKSILVENTVISDNNGSVRYMYGSRIDCSTTDAQTTKEGFRKIGPSQNDTDLVGGSISRVSFWAKG